jgi:fibronectin-binding autotransporter adhesin
MPAILRLTAIGLRRGRRRSPGTAADIFTPLVLVGGETLPMKRLTSLVAASLVLAIGLTAQAQIPYYFDVNDDASGSGVADGTVYPWDTTTLSWNTINADGTQASPGLNVAWTNGNNAIFSAGTDATGLLYGVNIAAGTSAANATIEEGVVQINSGVFDTGSGQLLVKPGAAIKTIIGAQFNGAGKLTLQGTSTADAGELRAANPGSAGTMISNLKTIEIDGFGRISYADGDATPDNKVSIINGSVITGVGGTPTNGGAGTLVKSGPDQVGYSVRDTGGGVFNYQLNSFAKLRVEQGAFRLRNTSTVIDERLFGALPLATLADAITLDGGGIGSNQTLTLSALRGITIGPNGGYFDNGATAGMIIPGPLTAAAGNTLTIGSVTSTSTANTRFELSNTSNTATFQGNLFMSKSTLRLNEGSNLNAAHFSGTGYSTTAFGTVEISQNTTLTAGTDNQDASFDGRINNNTTTAGTGGTFKWDGTGILTLNPTTPGTADWGNTGGVNINQGTIKYGTGNAGFATTAPVTIGATAKLNMNGIGDTFGSLAGPAGGTVDMKDTAATPGNLTLGATTGTTTYSGTITGGGNLTKSAGSTQILAGNTSLGAVAVNGGTLINNATMTTTGGVTVGAAGTLGGSGGTIIGAITNNGTIAPGASVGTLNVTGNVTDGAGSIWAIELLGATADKLAVTGNIDLSGADTLNVTGAGTGTSWIIGTYTGTETSVFDTITTGYSVTYTGGNITLVAVPACAPGDLNCDGHVDAGDYVYWRKNGGTPGDANYTAWRANFGVPPGSGSGSGLSSGGAVPEPMSLGLMLVGLAAFGLGRRKRGA